MLPSRKIRFSDGIFTIEEIGLMVNLRGKEKKE